MFEADYQKMVVTLLSSITPSRTTAVLVEADGLVPLNTSEKLKIGEGPALEYDIEYLFSNNYSLVTPIGPNNLGNRNPDGWGYAVGNAVWEQLVRKLVTPLRPNNVPNMPEGWAYAVENLGWGFYRNYTTS
ncbi:hypothetical protein CEK25_002882 [Fusarium fujikuroi]|nr:hypothetical protein CEK25_002882 [Fusarium fujikuroi]